MRRATCLGTNRQTLTMVWMLVGLTAASAARARAEETAAHRLLFESGGRIFVAELDIRLDGRPHHVFREQMLRQLAAEADPDGDRRVSLDDAAGSSIGRLGMLAYWARHAPKSQRRRLRMADEDEDGSLSLSELRRLFRLQLDSELVNTQFKNLSSASYYFHWTAMRQLDESSDGVLNAAEIQGAAQRLARLDRNANRVVDTQELQLAYRATAAYRAIRMPQTTPLRTLTLARHQNGGQDDTLAVHRIPRLAGRQFGPPFQWQRNRHQWQRGVRGCRSSVAAARRPQRANHRPIRRRRDGRMLDRNGRRCRSPSRLWGGCDDSLAAGAASSGGGRAAWPGRRSRL